MQFYCGYIGHDINNAAELEGLLYGLFTTNKSNFANLIVEGDSQIIIHMLTIIQSGSGIDKISTNWRMEDRLHQLKSFLSSQRVILLQHVMRTGNKLIDRLANEGVIA